MWAVYVRLVPVGGSLTASPGCWSQALDGTMTMFFGAPARIVSISRCATGFSADQPTFESIGSLNGSKMTLLAPRELRRDVRPERHRVGRGRPGAGIVDLVVIDDDVQVLAGRIVHSRLQHFGDVIGG